MLKTFPHATRAAAFALPVAALLAASALAPAAPARQQQQNQNQQQRAQKKKLQASSNFAQYAGRDAANRLIAGGATRGNLTDEAGQFEQKGQEAFEAGKYDEAIAAFRRVTEMKPDNAKAFYHLGVS